MKGIFKRFAALLTLLITAVSMLAMLPATVASAATTYTVTIKSAEKYQMAYQVLTLVNKERAKRGLSALKMDKNMLDAAMLRAAEQRISFSHMRPDGSDCFTAFKWEVATSENIAYGYTSAADVMDGWMNSDGHRKNILGTSYKKIGIGCTYIDGTYYWVQIFSGGSAVSVTKPADKTVSRTTKISSDFKADYIPSSTPKITSITTTANSATIKWGKVSKATGYRVYKYNATTKSYKSIATLSSSKLSFVDRTVKAGETAKYKVRAYRKVSAVTGWTSLSAIKSATIKPAQVKITSTSSSTNAVRLNWGKLNCTAYRIYRYDPLTRKYKTVATLSSGTTTYRISGLSRKTSYKFKMRAYIKTASGTTVFGPYSAVKTVTTK